jgi:hypothetical protein
LSSFGEACYYLGRNVGTEVDAQRKSHIVHANDVTKLLTAFELEKECYCQSMFEMMQGSLCSP